MNSEFPDFIGQGAQYYFDPSNSVMTITGSAGEATVNVTEWLGGWNLDFKGSGPLASGFYPAGSGNPHIDISAESRGCDYPTGMFNVVEVSFDTNNVPVSFWATFVQYCSEAPNAEALRGELRFNANPPVVLNVPARLTVTRGQNLAVTVSATSTNGGRVMLSATGLPAGASFVDNGDSTATLNWTPSWDQVGKTNITILGVDSQGASDYAYSWIIVEPLNGSTSLRMVDNGVEAFYTPTNGQFGADENYNHGVQVTYGETNGLGYDLEFVAPSNGVLSAGVYSNAAAYVGVLNSALPSMSVFGNGLSCLVLGGDFVVKQVVYGFTNDVIAYWGTFNQSCGPRQGEIKYNADAPVSLQAPFTASLTAGNLLSIPVTAVDENGNPVTLSAVSLPAGATFQDKGNGTGVFNWVPDGAQLGDFVAVLQAENAFGQFDTARIAISVATPIYSMYSVQDHLLYVQKQQGPPRLIPRVDPYIFGSEVLLVTNEEVYSVTLQDPDGQQQLFPDGSSPLDYQYSQSFSNLQALTAAFPTGTYQIAVTPFLQNAVTVSIELPALPFPQPPHVNNWLAAQDVNSSLPLTVTWDALPGGGTNDFIQLQIADVSGQIYFASPDVGQPGALNGTATAVVVPAGSLSPGQTYAGVLSFERVPIVDTTTYPLATGYGCVSTDTGFELKTLSKLRRGAGSLRFSSPTYIVNDNAGAATISVVRTGGNTLPASVSYATSNGTAQAGIDYTAASGTLVFSNGVTCQTFTIPIAAPSASNESKTVTLLLSGPSHGASLGARKAILHILGD
jgi:hypothetical protein